jgi:hypothetical protein
MPAGEYMIAKPDAHPNRAEEAMSMANGEKPNVRGSEGKASVEAQTERPSVAAGETPAEETRYSEAEAELAKQLTEGPIDGEAPEQEAVARLSPRWEIRIQSELDPVAEETAQYRKLAKEVDDRYDKRR